MARFSVASEWNKMSQQQKDDYVATYRDYVVGSYYGNLGEYNGQTVDVLEVVPLKKGYEMVRTVVKSSGSPDIAVDYRVKEVDGCLLVHDVVAEGISMVSSQRSEFRGVLAKEGVVGLTAILKEKVSK